MTHKLTPLWCMLPESGLNWTAWLMKPSHEMYFMFTVTSTACSSSRTHFPPGLYSLYYHSHLSPYVFIHCTIIHTLPMSTFSFTVHEIQQVCRIFTNHKIHKVFLQKASFLSSPKHTLYTAISCSMSVCPTGWQYIYISSNSWITLMINPCRQNEVKG